MNQNSNNTTETNTNHINNNINEESHHWQKVMRTMQLYSDMASLDQIKRQRHLSKLPQRYINLLPEITTAKYTIHASCITDNQLVFNDMVISYLDSGLHDVNYLPENYIGEKIVYTDQKRNEAVLHSLYREWSSAGELERSECFKPLITQLQSHLPVSSSNINQQRVLVPGCGLARLPLEIASKGYACEGNEFSVYMVIGSHFILNAVDTRDKYVIHPWIDKVNNVVNALDPYKSFSIPDRSAIEILQSNLSSSLPSAFSFSAGDFIELYNNDINTNAWDAVVTCFFIDTAPVIMEYIEVIHRILRPGGIWINLGPLLYHWASDDDYTQDSRYDRSIELSWEEVRHVIINQGFDITHEETIQTTYSACNDLMMNNYYLAKLINAVKPLDR